MATENFKSSTNLTPLQKMVGGIAATTAGYEVAKALVTTGSSAASAVTTGILKNDNISSSSSNEFFLDSVPERATAAVMSALRLLDTLSPENVLGAVTGGGSKVYPPDLKDDFRLTFDFADYVRPNPFTSPKLTHKGKIVLPLPTPLVESHNVSWQEAKTGVFGELFDAALVQSEDSAHSLAGRAGARGALEAVTRARLSRFALAHILPGDIDKQVEQVAGAILNPHLTQFFDGPTFQNHSFRWRFHPRSASESVLIRDICKDFKKFSLPARTVQGLNSFLSYPSIVEVSFNKASWANQSDSFLFPMKRCVISAVNIDYAPMGVLAFFKGTKAPRVIDLNIELKAIEFFLSEDFGGETKFANDTEFLKSLDANFSSALEAGKQFGSDVLKEGGKLLFGDNPTGPQQ